MEAIIIIVILLLMVVFLVRSQLIDADKTRSQLKKTEIRRMEVDRVIRSYIDSRTKRGPYIRPRVVELREKEPYKGKESYRWLEICLESGDVVHGNILIRENKEEGDYLEFRTLDGVMYNPTLYLSPNTLVLSE